MASAKQQAWLKQYVPFAQAEQKRTGVPASVTLAQLALETGWGTSTLYTKYNNGFGIKANKGWTGKTSENLKDYKEGSNDKYRAYTNVTESIKDHSDFLVQNKRYAGAFKYTNDPDAFARAIHAAGYATDSEYSNSLITTMNSNNLKAYDKVSSSANPAQRDPGAPGNSGSGANAQPNTGNGGNAGGGLTFPEALKPGYPGAGTSVTQDTNGVYDPNTGTWKVYDQSTGTPTPTIESIFTQYSLANVLWGLVGLVLIALGLWVAFNPATSTLSSVKDVMNAVGKQAFKKRPKAKGGKKSESKSS